MHRQLVILHPLCQSEQFDEQVTAKQSVVTGNGHIARARAGRSGSTLLHQVTDEGLCAQGAASHVEPAFCHIDRDSGRKVETGAELVNTSGQTLTDIVESVKKVGDIIAEIAAASAEQTAGIEQVNQAITHMDSMTQQNAALAERTSAASQSVGENAQELRQLVAYFKTN